MTTVSEFDLTAALRDAHKQITMKVAPDEFTIRIYAVANDVTNQAAVTLVTDGVESGLFVYAGKRKIKGHATNVYRLKSAPEVL